MEGAAKSGPNISLLLFNDPRTNAAAVVGLGVDAVVAMVDD